MKISSKFLVIISLALFNCKTHVDTITPLVTTNFIDTITMSSNNNHVTDMLIDRVVDTVENGRKVTIKYKSNKIIKTYGNLILIYKIGKLIYQSNDTIVNSVKMTYKKDIDKNNLTLTIYDKYNPKKAYDEIYYYKNSKLISKVKVTPKDNNNFNETKINFNDKGMIVSKTERKHFPNRYPNENQDGEITYYYNFKEKYAWSKLKIIKSSFVSQGVILNILEKSYYNIKNKLIKKDFFEHRISTYYEVFEDEPERLIEEIKLLKTQYYQKTKVVKIEEYPQN